MSTLPIIDLDLFLLDVSSDAALAEAAKLLDALVQYGAFVVKDSRASEAANSRYLDVMEDYFNQPYEVLQKDTRPEFGYQVGTTLENTERPSCHSNASCQSIIAALEPAERPLSTSSADPKCRFFHRMGRIPPTTSFPTLAMTNVTPEHFAETWDTDMEAWGQQIKAAAEDVVRMLSVSLGLGAEALLDEAGKYGPHLLAPTSVDLKRHGTLDTIFAGFHTDLNALTFHGRSRYPGLHVWARNSGKKLSVKMPPGHLLCQAGKQIEHLTNGIVLAGYHEVICSEGTVSAIATRLADPCSADRPLIRISSTFFWHFSSDYEMDPITFSKRIDQSVLQKYQKRIAGVGSIDSKRYGKMKVGELVQNELRGIELLA